MFIRYGKSRVICVDVKRMIVLVGICVILLWIYWASLMHLTDPKNLGPQPSVEGSHYYEEQEPYEPDGIPIIKEIPENRKIEVKQRRNM